MTEERKNISDGHAAISAQKKSGAKWAKADVVRLASSSLEVVQQYAANFKYVCSLKKEHVIINEYAQPATGDGARVSELLAAFACAEKLKVYQVESHPPESANSIAAIKRIATEAQKRKLKQEAAQEARIKRERAAAAEAQQRVKLKLATDFLQSGNFGGATRACHEAIEENPECSKAHYLLFFATNKVRNSAAFRTDRDLRITDFGELYAAMECASDDEADDYLADLADRVKRLRELDTLKKFMEFAAGYDTGDDEQEIVGNVYNDVMGDRLGSLDDAIEYFDVITQNMDPDSDVYFNYNNAFGYKVLERKPSAAQKYFERALEYCALNDSPQNIADEIRYKFYLAQSGVSSTSELLKQVGDVKKLDETVFARGCNEYAVTEICEHCLSSGGTSLINAEPLFEYAIQKLPQDDNDTAIKYLLGYAERLIAEEYFDRAKKYNERVLELNKDCHEAYFNRVLINKKAANPLKLIDYAENIFDDPDFYAATSAYAALNKSGNLYITIGDVLNRVDKKLSDSKCRKYVLRNCIVTREELAACESRVNDYINLYKNEEANRIRRERDQERRQEQERAAREREKREAKAERKERSKRTTQSLFLAMPAIILGVILIVACIDPIRIFQYAHYGWLVGVTAVVSFIFFISANSFYASYNVKTKMRGVKARSFFTSVGYLACVALMLVAIFHPVTIKIDNARQLQGIANLNSSVDYNYELTADIDLSDIKEFKSLPKLNSNCTFNGNNHVIKNMNITKLRQIEIDGSVFDANRKRYAAGLFAYNDGIINNVIFENCNVIINRDGGYNSSYINHGVYVGVAYGYNEKGQTINVQYIGCSASSSYY